LYIDRVTLCSDEISVDSADLPQLLRVGTGHPPVPLPALFQVREVGMDDGLVRLVARDGRQVRATPRQLATFAQLVSERVNPNHQAQVEAEFLDRAVRPADDTTDPALTMPVEDELFGTIVSHPPTGFGQTAEVAVIRSLIPWSELPVDLAFDAMSRDRLVEVLPEVHKVVAGLRELVDRAVDHLWESGGDDERADVDRETFGAAFRLMGVTIYHSADFGLDLDDSGRYFDDGYWPRVNFRADGVATELVVMA